VSATPQLQVIKLKNYDVTFDNATAPAFIAYHQTYGRRGLRIR
jgi:hypothetical protein